MPNRWGCMEKEMTGVEPQGEEVVDHLEPHGPGGVVNPRDVGQGAELGVVVVFEEGHHGHHAGGRDQDLQLVPGGELDLLDVLGEALGHVLAELGEVLAHLGVELPDGGPGLQGGGVCALIPGRGGGRDCRNRERSLWELSLDGEQRRGAEGNAGGWGEADMQKCCQPVNQVDRQ